MKINIQNKMRVVTIIAVNVIAIISISFFINADMSRESYEHERNNYNTLKSVQESVDSLLEINVNLTNVIALSNETMAYTNDSEINYYNVAKLASLLSKYTSFCKSRIYIFQPGKDIYIGSDSTYHKEDIIAQYGELPYNLDYLENKPGGCYSSNSMSDNLADNMVVFINKSITINGNDIYFIISLDERSLSRFFYENDTSICLIEDGNIVFGNNIYNTDIKKGKNIAAEVSSKVIHNWKYVYVSSNRMGVWIYLKWVLLILFSIAAASIIGWWISSWLYCPIKNLIEHISGDDIVGNELEYVERKIIDMQKSHERLQNEMNEYLNHFEQNFLKNVLYGISTSEEIREYERKAGKICGGEYALVLLECQDDEEKYSRTFYEVYEYIHKMSDGKMVGLGDRKIAVVMYRDIEDIMKEFTMILIGAEQRFDAHYIGAVSEERTSELEGIARLFAIADRTLKNKALFENNIMLRAQSSENNDYYYTVDMEKIIIDFIKNSDFDNAMSAIDSVLRKNLVECELTYETLTDFKLAMVSTIKRTLKMLGKNETELFGDDCIMYIELGAMRTTEGMRDKINSIFRTIFNSCKINSEGRNNFLVESILKYIHENYYDSDKVCLIGIAEHFNVSESYVSRIFKKYTNVNYKEYVTAYRIERAKEIMQGNLHIKIKDVSERVGYSNVNSFIRAFEKSEGITPDTFRKRQ